jgi:hypothetical protein
VDPNPTVKVKTASGEEIDRAEAAFALKEIKKGVHTFFAAKDNTVYLKMPNGSLRRVSEKERRTGGAA